MQPLLLPGMQSGKSRKDTDTASVSPLYVHQVLCMIL